jgi:phosphoglycerol transferase MdoB-like AlkP superfamily enzyme
MLLAIFVFWLIFFQMGRLIFLGLNYHLLTPSPDLSREIMESFFKSLSLDRAMAAYLVVIPWFFVLIFGQIKKGWLSRAMMLSTGFFTIVYSLIAVADAFLYPEWKSKLNARALIALTHPSEILKITLFSQILWATFLTLVYASSGILSFQWIISKLSHKKENPVWNLVILIIVWPVALGVIARGGTKAIAIDVSRVYFSKDQTLNDAATNPANYLIRSFMQSRMYLFGKNPFETIPQQDASLELKKLHTPVVRAGQESHTSIEPLTLVKKPNVVFLVLESWSADLIESLGGRGGITNQFAKLEKDGLLFTDFYANGNRSQQGIASIFSGFPALPKVTVTEDPAKTKNLPQIANIFEKHGYNSLFAYGGQLEYGNIKSFLIHSGFDRIVEDDDLPRQLPRSNLGVNDGAMLDYFRSELHKRPEPFFAGFFTLSSHAPYDIPDENLFTFEGLEAPYVKSVMYTDRELGRFISEIKNEPWYQNTLIVIVSDHSHNTFYNRATHDPLYRKIPLLFTGGALNPKYRGKKYDHLGSQVDIAATVLSQIGIDSRDFSWSKNLFNPDLEPFAYYEFGGGFGWITRKGTVVYDYDEKQIILSTYHEEDVEKSKYSGMSYLQSLFQTFIDL